MIKNAFKKIIPEFLSDIYYSTWPFFGAFIYRFPSKEIKVVGVTGTKGKTTVTHLVTEIFEEAGYKVGSISSLRFKVGDKEWKNELKMTMPGRMIIQKLLRQAVDAGCKYFVLEVTSEGIKQKRHKLMDFDVAVFTNLEPEHIESHGSFENYKKAKGELFKAAKSAVINYDDKNGEYFSKLCKGEKYYYEIKNQKSKIKITNQNSKILNERDVNFSLSLVGEFNRYNALAAVCVGLSQGLDMAVIKRALENAKGIPGRMEIVIREPYAVVVDYAHTPDSLRKVYTTLQDTKHPPSPIGYGGAGLPAGQAGKTPPFAPEELRRGRQNTKLICVLGAAGGGRDKWKRPEMGKIAAKYCDEIILTDEDPYDENPDTILEEIELGFSSNTKYTIPLRQRLRRDTVPNTKYKKILDRRLAIREALKSAEKGDVVVITGKGAEPWMMVKNGKIPWDDREVVREEMKPRRSMDRRGRSA